MPRRDPRLGRGSRRTTAGLVLAVLLLGNACALQDWRFEKHRERAAGYAADDQVELALIELYSALRIHPDHPQVNFAIAELESQKLNSAAAQFFYGEANRLDPTHVEAAVKLALLVLATHPDRGRELVERAAEREPANVWSSIGLSEVALVGGDTAGGMQAARQAVRTDADSAAARWQLARAYFALIREQTLQGRPISDELIDEARLSIMAYSIRAPDEQARAVLEYARLLSQLRSRWKIAARWFGQALQTANATGPPELESFAAVEALHFAREAGYGELRLAALRTLTRTNPQDFGAWKELAEVSPSGRDHVFAEMLTALPDDAGARMLIVRQGIEARGLDWAAGFLHEQAAAGVDPPLLIGFLADLQRSAGREKDWEESSRRLVAEHPQHPASQLARAHLELVRPAPDTSPEEAAENAAEILRALVEFEPSPMAHRLLAISESRLGNYARALDSIERAITLSGPSVELDRVHAEILHDAGFYKFAFALLLRLRAAGELTEAEQLMLARCAYRAGKPVLARRLIMDLLAKDEPLAGAAVELADHEVPDPRLHIKIMRALEKELASGSLDQRVLALATALDMEAGRRETALARLTHHIDREIALGLKLQQSARPARGREADRVIAKIERSRRQITGLTRYATTLQLGHDELTRVLSVLRAARKSGMLEPNGQTWLGRLQLQAGRDKEARASFERALTAGVQDVWVKNDLAILLARNRVQLDRALELAKEVVAGADEAEALDTLGYVYLRSGDGEAAVDQFRRAIARSEGDPRADFQFHLGLALAETGETDAAMDAFDAALSLDPELRGASEARARLEQSARAPDAAEPS